MSLTACVAEIEKAIGEPLEPEAQDYLAKQIDRLIRQVRHSDSADVEEAVLKAVEGYGQELVAAAKIEKRNAYLNKRAQLNALAYIRNTWADDPATGLTALLGGVANARQGARASVAAAQESLLNHYLSGMVARLEREGVHAVFTSGQLDREIWRAMHELNQPEPSAAALAKLPEAAVKIARVLNDYNELARLDANKAGAWIKPLPGYVIKQAHDVYRIRTEGWEGWRDFVKQHLDWGKTLPEAADKEKALRQLYTQLASGEHLKFGEGGASGFKGIANIGKKMSHERVLHFKDADAAFAYHQRFGTGTLAEGMMYGLERMAQNTALMRRLGPNAEMTLDEVIKGVSQTLLKDGDPARLDRFAKHAEGLKRTLWPNLTGASRIPGSHMGAQISAGTRQWMQMSKLGAAVLSAVSDIPFYASEVRYQGGTMLSGMADALKGLGRRTTTDDKELLGMLGVFHDGMRASVAARFDASDDIPGRFSKTTQLFFKLSGLRWWTDKLRTQFAISASHRLALNAGKAFGDLDPELQRVLGLFDIDAGKWDILRTGTHFTDAEGRAFLTPEGIDDLDDAPFIRYLEGRGRKPTRNAIRDLRTELKDQFRSYFFDRSTTAVLEPDARTRATLLRGTRPGTVEGEALRHVMLFKSFVAAVIQKPLAREVYGRGAGTLGQAIRNGNGEMLGLANLIVWNTAFGYAAMSLKDMAKGKEPRDPTDLRTWQAALVQGGGLGIYGDFLFGDMKNRFGGSALDTLLGPTAGAFNDVTDLFQRFRDGDDTAASTFRFAVNNTPFLNLFYTRWALDYLVLYRMSEWINPGYLRRMERRVARDTEQEYIVPPSQVIPYGG